MDPLLAQIFGLLEQVRQDLSESEMRMVEAAKWMAASPHLSTRKLAVQVLTRLTAVIIKRKRDVGRAD